MAGAIQSPEGKPHRCASDGEAAGEFPPPNWRQIGVNNLSTPDIWRKESNIWCKLCGTDHKTIITRQLIEPTYTYFIGTHTYSFGIDSMSVTPDCSKIYMPEGAFSSGGRWYVIDAATGNRAE
jgi:hypothetical protein